MIVSSRDIGGSSARRATELRLVDVEVFTHVVRAGSVNGAARALGVGASQVSKAISRVERILGVTLLARSARGIELSDDGRRMAPRLIDLLTRAHDLEAPAARSELVVAAPSFLWQKLAPRLSRVLQRTRIHALESRSNMMTALASEPYFDMALSVGEARWPSSWSKTRAGTIRRALFATPAKAKQLGLRVRPEALREETFIGRMVSDRGRLVPVPDGCPLHDRERRIGHRTETVAMALELARASDQLVFAPAIAVSHLARRGLIEIRVIGWDVREALYVVCHQDRVEAKMRDAFVAAARGIFEE